MRFNMDFSAEESGLLLVAIEELIAFREHSIYAYCLVPFVKAGIDVGLTLDVLISKVQFMVYQQNEETLQAAVQKLASAERPSV